MQSHSAPDRNITPTGWSVRWDSARAERAYTQGWWARETLADALRRAAEEDPGRVLIRDGANGVTVGRLLDRAERLARAMLARAKPGSVVSFMLPNWHEAAAIYLGATLAGMVANPILPSLRDHDLRFVLKDARTQLIFIPTEFRGFDYAAMLARIRPELPDPPEVVTVRGRAEGATRFEALFGRGDTAELPTLDPDDVRMVMYTSGTTGRPKGVLHTHNSIGALMRQIGEHWLVARGDRFLVPSPISHIGGSIYTFEAPLMLGSQAVLMERWDAAEAVRLMQRHRVTHMAGATPFLRGLLEAARTADTRLPDLKVFICGGASVPPALIREATGWFENACVSRVYGSTEVPVTTVGVIDRELAGAAESDGRPGIAEVRIAEDGEVRARGPQMLAGYINADDEGAAFDDDGFYRTGDQGRWDDTGNLVITGRIKDLIIRNGENIAPKEIEDLLTGHPDVAEVAIVGIPDLRTGERAVAVIVPRAGMKPDVAVLAEYLEGYRVARFKYPEAVELWGTLPKNDAGKVLKQRIREMLNRQSDGSPHSSRLTPATAARS